MFINSLSCIYALGLLTLWIFLSVLFSNSLFAISLFGCLKYIVLLFDFVCSLLTSFSLGFNSSDYFSLFLIWVTLSIVLKREK